MQIVDQVSVKNIAKAKELFLSVNKKYDRLGNKLL